MCGGMMPVRRRMPSVPGADGCRGSIVHFVHLRQYRKPKGVLHTTGGYLTYAATTHHYIFDYQPGDVYWCTADIGWITGHSYIVYGPMANRAITMMYEGVPNYPDFGRFWQIVQHKVNIFYTAPTACEL